MASKIFKLPESAPVPSADQFIVTSLITESTILNSRTLKVGDRIAHLSAAPRAAASSVLRVVEGSSPKTSFTADLKQGIREDPPIISIE